MKNWLIGVRRLLLFSTFIGVVIHEYAHKEFCQYYHIPVKEVCYFQFGNPPGYVVHARPKSYIASFMISVAPAILNTGLGLLIGAFLGYYLPFEQGIDAVAEQSFSMLAAAVVIAWVGVSVSVHNLPSKQDARAIWRQTKQKWYNPLVVLFIPVVFLIEVLNELRVLYIDILVGIAVFCFGIYMGVNYDLVIKVLIEVFTSGGGELYDLLEEQF